MKGKSKWAMAVALAVVCGAHAQGYIVPNGVLAGGYETGFGYRISVLHDPEGLNPLYSPYTQFWLNPTGITPPSSSTNTFTFTELTDIQVRVFLVSANDPIALDPILAGSYTELTYEVSASYVFKSGASFYVGHSGAFLRHPILQPYLINTPILSSAGHSWLTTTV